MDVLSSCFWLMCVKCFALKTEMKSTRRGFVTSFGSSKVQPSQAAASAAREADLLGSANKIEGL